MKAILINVCLLLGALSETPERKAVAMYFVLVAALVAADHVKNILNDEN
jgi:hypothetical protein